MGVDCNVCSLQCAHASHSPGHELQGMKHEQRMYTARTAQGRDRPQTTRMDVGSSSHAVIVAHIVELEDHGGRIELYVGPRSLPQHSASTVAMEGIAMALLLSRSDLVCFSINC